MRRFLLMGAMALLLSSALAFGGSPSSTIISGDYVEVRTASVFAGACHYNGELVTTGRDAMLAWNVKSGKWKGTDLAGVKAVAAVSADANLAQSEAARQSEIVVDSAASRVQTAAMIEALQARYGAALGKIVSVKRAPVVFRHEGGEYSVESPGFASLTAEAMPNDLCCRMPNLVWYSPLVTLQNRKVGFTTKASFAGGPIGEAWERAGENSAFYGSFSM